MKTGFTIAEVLVSMLILSIMFIGTSKVITHKPKQEYQEYRHGFFECYYTPNSITDVVPEAAGGFYQHIANELSESDVTSAPSGCNFNPPNGIAYAVVYLATPTVNSSGVVTDYKIYQMANSQINVDISGITQAMLTNPANDGSFYKEYIENCGELEADNENFLRFLKNAFPKSRLIKQLENNVDSSGNITYKGPALFIGW